MGPLALVNLSLHLCAAFIWIGSSVFLTLLWFPPFRESIGSICWLEFFLTLGRRYLRGSWLAIEVLVLTGIFNLLRVGVDSGFVFQPAFLRRLIGKLLIVAGLIALQIGLSRVWLPRLGKEGSGGRAGRPIIRALVATSVGGGVALLLGLMLRV